MRSVFGASQDEGRGGVAGSGRLKVCSFSWLMDDNNNNKHNLYSAFFFSKAQGHFTVKLQAHSFKKFRNYIQK